MRSKVERDLQDAMVKVVAAAQKMATIQPNVPPRITAQDRKRMLKKEIDSIFSLVNDIRNDAPTNPFRGHHLIILDCAVTDRGICVAFNKNKSLTEHRVNNNNGFMPYEQKINIVYNVNKIIKYGDEVPINAKGNIIPILESNNCPSERVRGAESFFSEIEKI